MYFAKLGRLLSDNNNVAYSLSWNWGAILLFALIWSYGFEKVAFQHSNLKATLAMVLVASAIMVVCNASRKYKTIFQEAFQFSNRDVLVLSIYCILFVGMTLFVTYNLDLSLVGDQLAHAQASQNQSMDLADRLIRTLGIPAKIEYKTIVRLVDCAILAAAFFVISFVRQYKTNDQVLLLILIFFLLKLGHHFADDHPPFRLFPLWLSATIFGLNDVSFRLVSLLALSTFAFVIYRFCEKHFNGIDSFLIGLSVGSTPLLLHVGSIVEQSIWTALSWTFILVSIRESQGNPNYIRWISIIAIASLMRATAFVAFAPIFLLMGIEYLRMREYKNVGKYLIFSIPVLAAVPFIWIQLSQGTPATSGDIAPLQKIMSSFENGFSLKVMYNNILLPCAVFLPFCLLPTNGNWRAGLASLALFILAYLVFYSVRPILWGVPRYQAELWIPFAILGFYNLAIMLGNMNFLKRYLRYFLALLVLYNVIVMSNLNWINRPVDQWTDFFEEVKAGNVRILSEGVYNISDALKDVKAAGYSKNTCKVGITYGVFSEVMNGYNIEEVESARANFPDCSTWGPLNIAAITKNNRIQLILFVDKSNKENEINQLLKSGSWKVWRTFYNEQVGSTIIGMVRK